MVVTVKIMGKHVESTPKNADIDKKPCQSLIQERSQRGDWILNQESQLIHSILKRNLALILFPSHMFAPFTNYGSFFPYQSKKKISGWQSTKKYQRPREISLFLKNKAI